MQAFTPQERSRLNELAMMPVRDLTEVHVEELQRLARAMVLSTPLHTFLVATTATDAPPAQPTEAGYGEPTVKYRDHVLGLSNGKCVVCGESNHRIQSHPLMQCDERATRRGEE